MRTGRTAISGRLPARSRRGSCNSRCASRFEGARRRYSGRMRQLAKAGPGGPARTRGSALLYVELWVVGLVQLLEFLQPLFACFLWGETPFLTVVIPVV